MRRILTASLVALTFTTVGAATAGAQDRAPSCAANAAQNACETARDLFDYMLPQLGTALVGGSHTLGVGSTLGGFPHFAIALRGNAVRGDLPDIADIDLTNAPGDRQDITTSSQFIGLPTVDLALGLYKGYPIGVSRMGGIDLLGSVTYVPDIDSDGVSIATTDGAMKFGVGVRVGILEQSLVVPGVSFSYLQRDLPTLDLSAAANNATFELNDFSVKTTSWRLNAQKNFLLFQLAAGFGQDTYDSEAEIVAAITSPIAAGTTNDNEQSLKRTTMYGSLGFNLFLAKVVAEIGRVSGGDVPTYNTFDEEADKARMYGSVGIRISF